MNEPPVSRWEHWQSRFQQFRQKVKNTILFTSGVLAALAALLLFNTLYPGPQQLTRGEVDQAIAQALESATPPPAFSTRVYEAIRPSLVLIQTRTAGVHGEEARRLGSGVIINDRGDILTSLHVVANASEIQLIFADGTQSTAEISVAQPENDIAVLSASLLPQIVVPAVLGNPNAMRIGDEAFAVGNPFGLYSSISAGVISGFGRSFQPANSHQRLEDLIQIDAAVNPGNSGGPLLNRHGQVVGIVVGIVNPTDDEFFIGIGFAVPIQVAASAAGSPSH
jgi:S1-C subfamily serine protease